MVNEYKYFNRISRIMHTNAFMADKLNRIATDAAAAHKLNRIAADAADAVDVAYTTVIEAITADMYANEISFLAGTAREFTVHAHNAAIAATQANVKHHISQFVVFKDACGARTYHTARATSARALMAFHDQEWFKYSTLAKTVNAVQAKNAAHADDHLCELETATADALIHEDNAINANGLACELERELDLD